MSDSYAKLFSSITSSTIWGESSATRVVWVTMLAMKRKDGCVYASIPGLARHANVTIEECEAALRCFLSPDPYSRTKEHEGRRIEEIDGGWRVLNAIKFDEMRSAQERKEYMREYMRNRRKQGGDGNENEGGAGIGVNTVVSNVSDVNPNSSSSSSSTSSNTKDQKQDQKPKQKPRARFVLPDWIDPEVWKAFAEMRKAKRKPMTDRAARLIVKKLDTMRAIGHPPEAILDQSIVNSWTDVYALKNDTWTDQRGNRRHGSDAVSQVEQAIAARERASANAVVLTVPAATGDGSLLEKND